MIDSHPSGFISPNQITQLCIKFLGHVLSQYEKTDWCRSLHLLHVANSTFTLIHSTLSQQQIYLETGVTIDHSEKIIIWKMVNSFTVLTLLLFIKLHHLNPLLTSTFFACLSLVIISNYVFEMRINDSNTWSSFILQLWFWSQIKLYSERPAVFLEGHFKLNPITLGRIRFPVSYWIKVTVPHCQLTFVTVASP